MIFKNLNIFFIVFIGIVLYSLDKELGLLKFQNIFAEAKGKFGRFSKGPWHSASSSKKNQRLIKRRQEALLKLKKMQQNNDTRNTDL